MGWVYAQPKRVGQHRNAYSGIGTHKRHPNITLLESSDHVDTNLGGSNRFHHPIFPKQHHSRSLRCIRLRSDGSRSTVTGSVQKTV